MSNLIPGFAQGALGVGQTIAGLIQNNNIGSQPLYKMSGEFDNVLNMYQSLVNSNMPGYDQLRTDLNQSQADSIRAAENAATSPNQLLEAAIRSQVQRDQGSRDLNIYNALFRLENIDRVADARYAIAAEEEKEFMMNKLDPWLRDKEVAESMTGAGLQNIFGALGGISGILNSES